MAKRKKQKPEQDTQELTVRPVKLRPIIKEESDKQLYADEERLKDEISDCIQSAKLYGVTKRWLCDQAGLSQPTVSRMEQKTIDPQLGTVLRALIPLGKTLCIVDIQEEPETLVTIA